MEFINKMIASIVWSFSRGSKEKSVFNIAYFGAKFIVSAPVAFLLFYLVERATGFSLPNDRVGSFLSILVVYPIVNYSTVKKTGIRKIIQESSEDTLDRYINYFRIGIIASMFVVFLFMFLLK